MAGVASTTINPKGIMRLQKELSSLHRDPLPGVTLHVDEHNATRIDAMLEGAEDTPYEGGFFHVRLAIPVTYPMDPPKATWMVTGQGSVRFHPQAYRNGKLCLSILGTWSGPRWSPVLGIRGLLLTVQSQIFTKRAVLCEPGMVPSKKQI